MSQLVIIRHGESQYNFGTTHNLDSQLTEIGMKQCCMTVDWLVKNLDLREYQGLTSPYLRCLQTASIFTEMTGVPVLINDDLREFHVSLKKPEIIGGGVNLPNRAVNFPNLMWNNWNVDYKFFPNEKIAQYIDRMAHFVSTLSGSLVLITHAVAHRAICDLLTNRPAEELKIAWKDSRMFLEDTAIHNCGITMVADGELLCFNKAAWAK